MSNTGIAIIMMLKSIPSQPMMPNVQTNTRPMPTSPNRRSTKSRYATASASKTNNTAKGPTSWKLSLIESSSSTSNSPYPESRYSSRSVPSASVAAVSWATRTSSDSSGTEVTSDSVSWVTTVSRDTALVDPGSYR
jgi:hypothetical protein